MGFDVSYHPIKEEEIQQWYFDVIPNFTSIHEEKLQQLAEQFSDRDTEFRTEQFRDILQHGIEFSAEDTFEQTHGFAIANIHGLFQQYFYIRGGMFSAVVNEHSTFEQYIKPWEEILKVDVPQKILNRIGENYNSGVFIPADKVEQLYNDITTNENIRKQVELNIYEGYIPVFLKALKTAIERKSGLLEATEVICPNPLDLNNSECYSYLLNCDIEGALLYQEVAFGQLKEIEEQQGMEEGSIIKKAEVIRSNVDTDGNITHTNLTNEFKVDEKPQPKEEPKKKKGFFQRLFGK